MSARLIDVLPAFAAELEALLLEAEPALAVQVRGLSIVDRCRFGDDFCATFYSEPRPDGSCGPSHRNVPLDPGQRMLILDVVGTKIACVEVLYRDEIREVLHSVLS